MSTPVEVAQWMLDQVKKHGELRQFEAVSSIKCDFGEEFVYQNENGNLAISKQVLKEFSKISEDIIVWSRRYLLWRLRDEDDTPGKRQTEY